jgi:hypothetical protein
LPDSLARQPCPAALPGSLARQPCPAALLGTFAQQHCMNITIFITSKIGSLGSLVSAFPQLKQDIAIYAGKD